MSNTLRPQPGQKICFYGRVSTPRQKLEHQREMVQRWLDNEGITIQPEWYFEDKEKRHKSEVREGFQQILSLAKARKIEWIIVACFDRWGVASTEEFFSIRTQLKETGARLYSVQDQLDLTGNDDMAIMRICMLSIAATTQMGFYADRNIMKMVSMAQGGWHASKEHPFGTDLLCCRLSDKKPLFRVHCVSKDFERRGPRTYKLIHFNEDGGTTEDTVTRMPPRDCKQTGYRLSPTIDIERVETVRLVFKLFDQGMTFREIGNHLHAMGRTYFGKFFGAHAIESILRNPAFVGRPAWGKTKYGAYKQVFDMQSVSPEENVGNEPKSILKDEKHFVFPLEPVFDPEVFIPLSLWERVQQRFHRKTKKNYATRRASKTIHPLNGLMACPECGRRMVINNCTRRNGERVHYYICGGYSKSGNIACRPNSVRFTKVDRAMKLCWNRVADKLKTLGGMNSENTTVAELRKQAKSILDEGMTLWFDSFDESDDDLPLEEALERWRIKFIEGNDAKKLEVQDRIKAITERLETLAERVAETASKTVRMRLNGEAEQLEKEKEKLEMNKLGLVERISSMLTCAIEIYDTIDSVRLTREAEMWETFIDRVEPTMEVLQTSHRNAKRPEQRICTGFQFFPKTSANHVMPHVLEVCFARRDRGSSPPPA